MAAGWKNIQDSVIGNETLREDLNTLKERENEKLPDEYDIQGAAFGLLRLKSTYDFKMKPFIQDGVLSTMFDDGQVVLSKPSIQKLNSK